MMRPPFTELYFGKSDPVHEAMENPNDFIRSFVDFQGAVEQVISGRKTLILGPKGTGKSALGLYIEKTSTGPGSPYFARMRNASYLPLAEIPRIDTGQPAGPLRTYNAWKFILLANYLDVALEDPEVKLPYLREIKRIFKEIRSFGFIGQDSGRSILRLDKTSYNVSTAGTSNLFRSESGNVSIYTLTPYLVQWAAALKSPHRHILMLDGLDSMFLNDPRYDESLSGLTQAAYEINLGLRSSGSTGSIVLLIRNDIFSRVSLVLPDAHKMRDFGFDLDWRVLSGAAGENAPLIQLVDRKASQERGGESVKTLEYFPSRITLGASRRRHRGRSRTPQSPSRLQYFLNLTRHTPRDILQLMEHIRLSAVVAGDGSDSTQAIRAETIREGVVQYSTKYFVDAIRGEFAGYDGGPSESEAALNALKLMQKPAFTRSDYRASLAIHSPGLEAKTDGLLKLLFFAGALGNLFNTGSERHMIFYHRRNDVDLNVQGNLVLHNALTHAWSKDFGLRY